MPPARNVSTERVQEMLAFLAKHPDVDFGWLDRVASGQVTHPILPTRVPDITSLVRAKIITQTEAKALALTGRMPELTPAPLCVAADCVYERTTTQLFQLGQLTLHIPMCADHNTKWEREAARMRKRRRWGR